MIDKDEAIRLLRKEVANKGGDFVYRSPLPNRYEHAPSQTCVYAYNGEPSCIVGYALVDAGVDPVMLSSDDWEDVGATALPGKFPGVLDNEAAQVFSAAQSFQDNGLPWSTALEAAENTYRSLGGTE